MEYPIIHLPKYAKKYCGGIQTRNLKTKTSYLLAIRTGDVRYAKSFSSYEEAFEMMKQKNLEFDLPIKNKIFEFEDYWSVELTCGMWCKFDIEDREIVESYVWFFNGDGYAQAVVGERGKLMHQLVMNHDPTDGLSVDHISQDTLDNRKVNLRIANWRLQNLNKKIHCNNTTGIIGVYYSDTQRPKWISTWVEDDGTKRSKSFNVGKYGFNQAKQLAIDQRRLIERTLPDYINARTW